MKNLKLKKVAGYRVMLGLTHEEIGKYLGMSKQQCNSKENGHTSFNDVEKSRIKDLLQPYFPKITIDDIFF